MAEEIPNSIDPHAFWSGTITFGLVSVPVDLYPAVRSDRVPLRMMGPEGQPLRRRFYCSTEGRALEADEMVRGYQREDGGFTVVTDEELDALAPRKSRDIDLRRFVQRNEIPPRLLERAYVLAPAGESTKAYHLLAETMERTGRVGIATFVMRGKEYLAAIFAEGGSLRAATMRFVDELRTPEEMGLPNVRRASAERLHQAVAALEKLVHGQLDTDLLHDTYSEALLALAERKRAESKDVVEVAEVPPEDEDDLADVIDIMSVLKRRIGANGAQSTSERRADSNPAQGSLERRRKKSGTSRK
jgi:DNA end-binding protein Ku